MSLILGLKRDHQSYIDLYLGPEDRFRENIHSICGLFITIIDSKIYLLHQTAREFLIQGIGENIPSDVKRFKWRHSLRLQESHCILTMICIQYLLFTDFENAQLLAGGICGLTDSYAFLDYSARYWTTHLLESKLKTDEMLESLLMLYDASTVCYKT
jgi:ankyrin repeat domain-containing protein 50